MTRLVRSLFVGLSLFAAASAGAEELPRLNLNPPALLDEGGGEGAHGTGSYLSGRTLGSGDAILAQFGWPGMSVSYLHPATGTVDVGGTFTFNYGFEGRTVVNPGLKFAGLIRLNLFDNGKANFGLRFDPGIAMYFKDEFAFGLQVPVAFVVGVAVGEAVMVNFGIDMPMVIFFTQGTFFLLPIQPGFGIEYHVDSHLTVTLDTRFGPSIFIKDGSETEFSFRTLAGVGYRF